MIIGSCFSSAPQTYAYCGDHGPLISTPKHPPRESRQSRETDLATRDLGFYHRLRCPTGGARATGFRCQFPAPLPGWARQALSLGMPARIRDLNASASTAMVSCSSAGRTTMGTVSCRTSFGFSLGKSTGVDPRHLTLSRQILLRRLRSLLVPALRCRISRCGSVPEAVAAATIEYAWVDVIALSFRPPEG